MPTNNVFDLGLLYGELDPETDQELAGFFSSIKKAFKKVTKKIKKVGRKLDVGRRFADKVKSKIGRKIFSKKQLAKFKKIERRLEPVKRAAKVAVASYFVGPLAGKLVGGVAAKAGFANAGQAITAAGAKMGSGSLVKAVGKAALKSATTTAAKQYAQRKLQKKALSSAKKQKRKILLKQYKASKADLLKYYKAELARFKQTGASKKQQAHLKKRVDKRVSQLYKKYKALLKKVSGKGDIQGKMEALFTVASRHIKSAQKKNANIISKIAADKQFRKIIAKQKAEGKSDNEIAKEWGTSETFKNAAFFGAYNQILPEIVAQYEAAGMTPEQALDAGKIKANEIAATEVKKVEATAKGEGGLLAAAAIGIPLIFAAVGG